MAEPQSPAALPLYLRVAAALRDDLTQRRIAPGTRLPSERSLVHRFRVNRHTVRNALQLLRDERLVVTERRGTFAAAAAPEAAGPVLAPGLLRFPCGTGTPEASAVTRLAWEPTPTGLAERLGLLPGEPSLVHHHEVPGAAGTPVQEALSRFSRYALAEVPELARFRRPEAWPARPDLRLLYHWMHRAGLRLTRRESIGVGHGPVATTCLTVHRVVSDQHGHVLEVTDIRFAPESASWTYEFTS
ncbi:GntR family transcriptional regulator [Streptomyces sp. CB03238]|uniref:GntR family transcriptional regulator n=1 Tax=Streptomyces sp. CB03238 TaxID=1907777 RepID=UPI000A0F434A|nr:GntR family transcriptional regulator [Streptomyces sp. CB03238]ORT56008.1 GntR family transcriptional regulator [Streptomyces sp. CB03238]